MEWLLLIKINERTYTRLLHIEENCSFIYGACKNFRRPLEAQPAVGLRELKANLSRATTLRRSARVSWCLILQFISPERPWLLSWPRQRLLWIFLYFCSSWPHFKKTWDYLRFLLWTKLRWYGANATQRISIQSTDTLISSNAMVINL